MTRKELIEFLMLNEPSFIYNGKEYGICYPGTKVLGWEIGKDDTEQRFNSIEDLVDNWVIDGKNILDIAPIVFGEYFN